MHQSSPSHNCHIRTRNQIFQRRTCTQDLQYVSKLSQALLVQTGYHTNVVAMISSCQVYAIVRRGTKQLGSSFGTIKHLDNGHLGTEESGRCREVAVSGGTTVLL